METISQVSERVCDKCGRTFKNLTELASDDGFFAVFCDECLVIAGKRYILADDY